MLSLILICLTLCFIGFILNKEITIEEFLGNCVISILCSLIVFGLCILPYQNDYYFQSGRLIKVEHHPYFVEEYEQPHEVCTSCGKNCTTCHTYYTTEHAKHSEYWMAYDSIGQKRKISKTLYETVKKDFGNNLHSINNGSRYRCNNGGYRIKGDNSLYYYKNDTNTYNYPTTAIAVWYNPLKKSKSIFNTEKDILAYPIQQDWFSTNRDMTRTFKKKWDILNTKIYQRIKANVILTVSKEDLKNAWMKGKYNDIIIQVNSIENPTEVKVFGWYKSERLSRELETYILDNGINLDGIQHKILSYYEPFDFSEFDYLRFQLADWEMLLISIITVLVMIGSYVAFSTNEFRR